MWWESWWRWWWQSQNIDPHLALSIIKDLHVKRPIWSAQHTSAALGVLLGFVHILDGQIQLIWNHLTIAMYCFFLSKTGSSCRQMNEDGTCPREFFILYLFWVSKPTPITPAMASNASIWFKMVTSSAARQWQVELEMAMLWTQTFCLMMSWSMRARYSRPGGQSTGTRFWETCRKNWCAGINKVA